MIDEILKSHDLKYEDLSQDEIKTLNQWGEELQKATITVSSIREHILGMKAAVEVELAQVELSDDKDKLLKARLRNYLLLEAMMSTPEQMKLRIENALIGMKKKVI